MKGAEMLPRRETKEDEPSWKFLWKERKWKFLEDLPQYFSLGWEIFPHHIATPGGSNGEKIINQNSRLIAWAFEFKNEQG